MKLTSIEMRMAYPGYGERAVPGITCEVEFEVNGYGSRFTVKLEPEQVKQVASLAAHLALKAIEFDPATIDVVGNPGIPRPEPMLVDDISTFSADEPL